VQLQRQLSIRQLLVFCRWCSKNRHVFVHVRLGHREVFLRGRSAVMPDVARPERACASRGAVGWVRVAQGAWLMVLVATVSWAACELSRSVADLVQVVESRAGSLEMARPPEGLLRDALAASPETAPLVAPLSGHSALVLIFDGACPYCDLNMSRWLELVYDFRQDDIPVVALSSDGRPEALAYWRAMAEAIEIHASMDRRLLTRVFGAKGTPCTALVRDGRVVGVFHGALDSYRQSWLRSHRG
jgi:hypothetical protein